MQTEQTLNRARREAATIAAAGRTNVEVISLAGFVGGRETSPVQFHGHAVRYTWEAEQVAAGQCIKFWPGDDVRECERSMYVVDGRMYYVAGWQGDGGAARIRDGYVLLHPVDEVEWMMPRRAYVFRTSTRIAALKGEPF